MLPILGRPEFSGSDASNLGMVSIFVVPHLVQVHTFFPAAFWVGAFVIFSHQLWGFNGVGVCSVTTVLQTEQWLPAVKPYSVQVAGIAGSMARLPCTIQINLS